MTAANAAALARAAHSLKGSSSSVGMAAVSALCAELEHAGTSGAVAAAGTTLEKLERELTRIRPVLEGIVAGAGTPG